MVINWCQGGPYRSLREQDSEPNGDCTGEGERGDALSVGQVHRDARPLQAFLPLKTDAQGSG